MDCYPPCDAPLDDLCDVFQATPPSTIPFADDLDRFYLKFEGRTTVYPFMDDSEDEDEVIRRLEEADVETTSSEFWTLCRRSQPDSLAKDDVLRMLAESRVPRCKRDFMSEKIESEAGRIAGDNKEEKVVALAVWIDMFACGCYGESVEDPE